MNSDVSFAWISCQTHVHDANSDESADFISGVVARPRDAGEERNGFDLADHVFQCFFDAGADDGVAVEL